MNLATAYSERIQGERGENLEEAIQGYIQALEVFTREAFPQDWATTKMNLATAYSERIQGERGENLEEAMQGNIQALEVLTREAFPEDHCNVCHNYAVALRDAERFEEALVQIRAALETAALIRATVKSGSEGKRAIAKQRRQSFDLAIQIALRLKQPSPDLAAEFMDAAKTQALSDGILSDEAMPDGDFDPEDLAELHNKRHAVKQEQIRIERATRGTVPDRTRLYERHDELQAFVQLVVAPLDPKFQLHHTAQSLSVEAMRETLREDEAAICWHFSEDNGVLAVLLTAGDAPTVVHWGANAKAMDGWLQQWAFAIHLKQGGFNFHGVIKLLSPLLDIDQLMSKVPAGCRRLVLVPDGVLHLLPFTALPLSATGTRLGDRFEEVTVAPSLQLLRIVRARPAHEPAQGLCLIGNPTEDLKYTDAETAVLEAFWCDQDAITARHGKDATRDAVLRGPFAETCSSAALACFSCHGFFNKDNSGLFLAGKEKLTIRDILEHLRLPRCDLTMLSACESGQAVESEYVGLPAAFLVAGSRCVLGALWCVDDMATCVLLVRFLSLLADRDHPRSVGVALREAQRWMATSPRYAIHSFLEHMADQLPGAGEALVPVIDMMDKSPRFESYFERPYADPAFWAAFVLVGDTSVSLHALLRPMSPCAPPRPKPTPCSCQLCFEQHLKAGMEEPEPQWFCHGCPEDFRLLCNACWKKVHAEGCECPGNEWEELTVEAASTSSTSSPSSQKQLQPQPPTTTVQHDHAHHTRMRDKRKRKRN